MAKQLMPRQAITVIEVVVTVVACSSLLLLLLPALVGSREEARANLCRKNLRRMFVAAESREVLRSPLAAALNQPRADSDPTRTWPVLLARELHGKVDAEGPRPSTLTCPSRPLDLDLPPVQQKSHYAAVVVWNKADLRASWTFRDRELEIRADRPDQWASAVPQRVAPPLSVRLEKGPHAGGTFHFTDSQGNVITAAPQVSHRVTLDD